jgi:plastocyanin
MPPTLRKPFTAAAALTVLAAAAAFAPASLASGDHVTIKGSSLGTYHFAPKTLHIQKGDDVHWSWNSNAAHNVTFTSIGAHSRTGTSESFHHRFKKAGTYHYLCTIHDFKGKIVVG